MNLTERRKLTWKPRATVVWGMMVSAALLALSGCGRQPAQFAPPPPEVGVITIAPESVALTTELPGRIDPVRVAQVRARVDGIVLHRNFREGADVTNGEVLYQIDPAPYQATLDSANASLMQAQQLVQRYQPLVGINAVSKQDYDNAVAAAAQAKAAQEIAAVNFGYCTVTAPISGQIGAALVTEGALVSQSAATEMAVVTQLDPIYFDFTESSTEVLRLRARIGKWHAQNGRARRSRSHVAVGRRDDVSAPRQIVVLRYHGGPDQRHGYAARGISQSRPFAAAGHVCAGRAGTGGGRPSHHRSPTRRQHRTEWRRHRDGRRRGRQSAGPGNQDRPGGGNQMGGHRRIEGRRTGHR